MKITQTLALHKYCYAKCCKQAFFFENFSQNRNIMSNYKKYVSFYTHMIKVMLRQSEVFNELNYF